MNNRDDGGEAILEAFRNLGVDYVISSPGSEWPPVWEAFARQKAGNLAGPTYLDCGHEILAIGIAVGFTQMTGRVQAVLLHAGSGLLQGAMGIQGARASELPMIVMSGESLSYGEDAEFDPGNQWYRNLGVVGGPQRLVEPVVKWASQVPSIETLYHSVVRAGELAQRIPQGPVYLSVPIETMMDSWTPPPKMRRTPAAPKTQALPDDIEAVATLIEAAKFPLIITESAGRTVDGFQALLDLAELMAIPVIEGRAASYANFPKAHPLHLGTNSAPYFQNVDLALLIGSRVPWYPPSNCPPQAKIVAVSENPIKDHMVYQTTGADIYLEGDLPQSLRLLTHALKNRGQSADKHAARRTHWQQEHERLVAKRRTNSNGNADADAISTSLLCQHLNELMPANTIYLDETIVHSPILREQLEWHGSQSFFRIPSGLGQGFGIALGTKLAAPDRPVVLTIGDGSFLYNPVLPSLTFSKDHDLPILILVCNNNNYEVMRKTHLNWYPSGVSATKKDFYGVHINAPDYGTLAAFTGGHGARVDKASELKSALAAAIKAVESGKTAILNVMLSE